MHMYAIVIIQLSMLDYTRKIIKLICMIIQPLSSQVQPLMIVHDHMQHYPWC